MDYEKKYLKYKEKYLNLKNQMAGMPSAEAAEAAEAEAEPEPKEHVDKRTGFRKQTVNLSTMTSEDATELIFKASTNLYYYYQFNNNEEYHIYLNESIKMLRDITEDNIYHYKEIRVNRFKNYFLNNQESIKSILSNYPKKYRDILIEYIPEIITINNQSYQDLIVILQDLNHQLNKILKYILFIAKKNKKYEEDLIVYNCLAGDFRELIFYSEIEKEAADAQIALYEINSLLTTKISKFVIADEAMEKFILEEEAEKAKSEKKKGQKKQHLKKVEDESLKDKKDSKKQPVEIPKLELPSEKETPVKLQESLLPEYFNTLPLEIKLPKSEIADEDFNEDHKWHIIHKINIYDIMQIYLKDKDIRDKINNKIYQKLSSVPNVHDGEEVYLQFDHTTEPSHLSIHSGKDSLTPETLYHYKFSMICIDGIRYNVSYKFNFRNNFVFNRVWSRGNSGVKCTIINKRHIDLMDIIVESFNDSLLNPNNLYKKILELQELLRKKEDHNEKGTDFDISPYESIESLKIDIAKYKSWMK